MKIMVFPRNDQNPYQRLLYGEMGALGAQVSYLGCLTASHTLNVLLLPLELALRRARGAKLLHLHWVFGFSLPGGSNFPVTRHLAQAWFSVWLWIVKFLRIRLIWTAHNVLPHETVFANDRSARCALVAASDLILMHSQEVLPELKAIGAAPSRSAVIPHGPLGPLVPVTSLRNPGTGSTRRFLFFGNIQAYKGVDDLLAAFLSLSADLTASLTIVGQCLDSELRTKLVVAAEPVSERVSLRLERLPEDEVSSLLVSADVVVLPYRKITTSGTAMLALAYGRPLVIPDLKCLSHLSDEAVLRFDGTVPSLASAIERLTYADESTLRAMSNAAYKQASEISWKEIAAQTMAEMASLLITVGSGTPEALTDKLNGRTSASRLW